jgi:hypothetical protein
MIHVVTENKKNIETLNKLVPYGFVVLSLAHFQKKWTEFKGKKIDFMQELLVKELSKVKSKYPLNQIILVGPLHHPTNLGMCVSLSDCRRKFVDESLKKVYPSYESIDVSKMEKYVSRLIQWKLNQVKQCAAQCSKSEYNKIPSSHNKTEAQTRVDYNKTETQPRVDYRPEMFFTISCFFYETELDNRQNLTFADNYEDAKNSFLNKNTKFPRTVYLYKVHRDNIGYTTKNGNIYTSNKPKIRFHQRSAMTL